MTLVWKTRSGGQRKLLFADWEAAAVEARRLIMFEGATQVAIWEEA